MDSYSATSSPDWMMYAIIAGASVAVLLILGIILSKLYVKATKDKAFIKTGMGGEKVVMNGGSIVIPAMQEVAYVNMETLRIVVEKTGSDALISQDDLLVDVESDFYIRVNPKAESISTAAQTLGERLLSPDRVKEVMESKLVDGLRSVAASMSMDEMHLNRSEFVQRVQTAVAEDLEQNGLMLESVSLTSFNQTPQEFFQADNAFHAKGLAKLATITEQKRKETNDTKQKARIEIEQTDLEAEAKSLEIKKQEEQLKLNQEKEIEESRAQQQAEIATKREEQTKNAEAARISRERAVEQADIEKDKQLEAARIAREKELEAARIAKQQSIEVSEADKMIAIAQKSEEENAAKAKAAEAEIARVEKEEEVKTTQEMAEANRQKNIEVIRAQQEAEKDKAKLTIEAQAKAEAAANEAQAVRVRAEAEAEAEERKAQALAVKYQVEAEGKLAINNADNTLNIEWVNLKKTEIMLKNLPQIIKESVDPIKQVDSIKILQGYNGDASGGSGQNKNQSAGVDGVVNGLLNYRMQKPVVDSVLQELGLVQEGQGLNELITNAQFDFPSSASAEANEAAAEVVTDSPTEQIVEEIENSEVKN